MNKYTKIFSDKSIDAITKFYAYAQRMPARPMAQPRKFLGMDKEQWRTTGMRAGLIGLTTFGTVGIPRIYKRLKGEDPGEVTPTPFMRLWRWGKSFFTGDNKDNQQPQTTSPDDGVELAESTEDNNNQNDV